jgi:ABC-type polysaccharide/polyol phosphate transport system ATPase subunit
MKASPLPPAVVVDGVSKDFAIPREQVHTLKERALHPFRQPGHDILKALRDVSFAVEHGEFFGIVGRNGSGKSTLLKCLAGIYRTDVGRIYVNGRMSTFIELGVGFNPDLAAYENVMLNATMLGLSPREAKRRYDTVIEFAELQDFADLKIKNYSSGMLVRLAFSVMIQVDADILLIDEVLAVGDAAFQQKCFDEFGRIRRSGSTVLLVTHDMGSVQRFCDRGMLLEHGRLVEIGGVQRVADRYLELNFSPEARAAAAGASPDGPVESPEAEGASDAPAEERTGDGRAEITAAWVEDDDGNRTGISRVGERCRVVFNVVFKAQLVNPVFGVNIHDATDNNLLAVNNVFDEGSGTFMPGDEVTVHVSFENYLGPDRYWISPAVAQDRNGLRMLDRRHRFVEVVVTGSRPRDGMTALPSSLTLERAGIESTR